jgi:hypothetical protein
MELELRKPQPRFSFEVAVWALRRKKMTKAGAEDSAVMTGRDGGVDYDPEFADILDESPSRVTVTLADGHTVQRMRYYASGTPQAPLTKEQVEEKFFLCAERAVDKAAATSGVRCPQLTRCPDLMELAPAQVRCWHRIVTSVPSRCRSAWPRSSRSSRPRCAAESWR